MSSDATPREILLAPAAAHGSAIRLPAHMPALDGLRGTAILLVLLFHFAGEFQRLSGTQTAWLRVLRMGWVGVDLFFVLSGFLITGILLDARERPQYFRNFYARRMLRIFPLYFAFLALVFGPIHHYWASHIYLLQDAYERQGWWWLYSSNVLASCLNAWTCPSLDHFWSLAVEEHFYLIWPLLVFFLSRRHFIIACLICMLCAAAARTCAALHHGELLGYTFTLCRMDSLCIGALLAALVRSGVGSQWLIAGGKMVLIAAAVLLLAIAARQRGFSPLAPLVQTAGHSLLAVLFACLLFFAVALRPSAFFPDLLARPALRFFGKYAYGMYVIHPILEPLRIRSFSTMGKPGLIGFVLFSLVGIATALLAALVSWHLLEKHFVALKRFF